MKLIAKMLHAFDRATTPQASAPPEKEVPHDAEFCPTINDVATAVSPDKSSSKSKDQQHVTIRLNYAGEDTKYLMVRVAGKKYKISLSRIRYVRHGDDVVVTMTRKYAASRPELAVTQ